MDLPIILGLATIVVTAVLDVVLTLKWNRTYYTAGIPIFVRRVERPEGIADVSLDELEQQSKTAAGAPLAFHRFEPGLIGIRDRVFGGTMHYIPIMHGFIRHEPAEGAVRVVGILNWFVIGYLACFLGLLGRNFVDLLPVLLGVLGVIYFIQFVRYNRVAKKLGLTRAVSA